jgi:hypothetical protein
VIQLFNDSNGEWVTLSASVANIPSMPNNRCPPPSGCIYTGGWR